MTPLDFARAVDGRRLTMPMQNALYDHKVIGLSKTTAAGIHRVTLAGLLKALDRIWPPKRITCPHCRRRHNVRA